MIFHGYVKQPEGKSIYLCPDHFPRESHGKTPSGPASVARPAGLRPVAASKGLHATRRGARVWKVGSGMNGELIHGNLQSGAQDS